MDKLAALPLPQKLGLLLVLLGLIVGAFYYLVVSDASDQIGSLESRKDRLEDERDRLKQYEDRDRLAKLERQEAEESAKIEENKRMLPTEKEIPAFIEAIKADADAAGLLIDKVEQQAPIMEDYYNRVPIRMEVTGQWPALVEFLRILSTARERDRRRRVVNVREIQIEQVTGTVDRLREQLGMPVAKKSTQPRKAGGGRDRTDEEIRAEDLREWQEANAIRPVKASFVAYTFTFTGKPMPADARKKRRGPSRRKQRRL